MTAVLVLYMVCACNATPSAERMRDDIARTMGHMPAAPDTAGPRAPDRFGSDTGPRVRDPIAQHRPARGRGGLPHTSAQRPADDRWLAIDKAQHFAMAYGTAMFGYGALRSADVTHRDAQTAALAGSLAIGVGKELFDRARGGAFSFKDLTMDALGTLAAWGMLSLNR